jgi:hypothetical protein
MEPSIGSDAWRQPVRADASLSTGARGGLHLRMKCIAWSLTKDLSFVLGHGFSRAEELLKGVGL